MERWGVNSKTGRKNEINGTKTRKKAHIIDLCHGPVLNYLSNSKALLWLDQSENLHVLALHISSTPQMNENRKLLFHAAMQLTFTVEAEKQIQPITVHPLL